MNAGLKYSLARAGLFVVCAALAVLLLPDSMNIWLKAMVGMVVSAVLALVLLRKMRDEVAEQMLVNARRKAEQKERLRAALAGEDETSA